MTTYGVAFHSFELGVYWLLTFILVPVACAALQLLVVGVHLEFFPNVNDIGRELDHGHVDGESLEHSRKDNTFVPLQESAPRSARLAARFGGSAMTSAARAPAPRPATSSRRAYSAAARKS